MTKDTLELKAVKEFSPYFNLDTLHLQTTNISNTETITTQKDGTYNNNAPYRSYEGGGYLIGLGGLLTLYVIGLGLGKIFPKKKKITSN